jgi:hypothetical protein
MKYSRAAIAEAERALMQYSVMYVEQADGTLLVPGDLDLSGRQLFQLPALGPVSVAGNFYCYNNFLTSLEGAPHSVGKGFYCYNNNLKSLKGAPETVGGEFWCDVNQLSFLNHAPAKVGSNFHCNDNPLVSLEGAPKQFKQIKSDFGTFQSWQDIPEHLKVA